MSLLNEMYTPCVFMDKKRVPDDAGGFLTTWTEGAEFSAAVTFSTSIEARVAEKQGVTSLYTVTTPRKMTLEYHDVFKRLSDGKIFRVTSDGDDKAAPKSATLDMRQVTAEEWSIPT